MAATAARAAPHPATPIAQTRAVPPASVAILRISYTPSKTAGSNTLTPNLRARVVGLGARRVPDGQPFGLGPAGVAVAVAARQHLCPALAAVGLPAEPTRDYRTGRCPRTRRSGAFGFTTMPTVALCRPPRDTLVIPSAAIWRCQLH